MLNADCKFNFILFFQLSNSNGWKRKQFHWNTKADNKKC